MKLRPMHGIIAGVILVTAVAGGVALHHGGGAASVPTCGVERWPVKTLTDSRPVNLTPVAGTVAQLSALAKAPSGQTTRLPAETITYTVTAQLTGFKLESDLDIHAVISDGTTMIIEFPNPACIQGSPQLATMTQARNEMIALCGQPSSSFRSCGHKVTVTGVLFLDFLHGQTGVAKNGVELHPVLKLAVLP